MFNGESKLNRTNTDLKVCSRGHDGSQEILSQLVMRMKQEKLQVCLTYQCFLREGNALSQLVWKKQKEDCYGKKLVYLIPMCYRLVEIHYTWGWLWKHSRYFTWCKIWQQMPYWIPIPSRSRTPEEAPSPICISWLLITAECTISFRGHTIVNQIFFSHCFSMFTNFLITLDQCSL